jgi:hypothetical protein
MKIITVPEDVKDIPLKFARDGVIYEMKVTFEFTEWCVIALDSYAPNGKGAKAARQAAEIVEILETAKGEKTLGLGASNYEVVKGACEALALGAANRKLVSFHDAIENAEDQKVAGKKE